jgi:hypothetical protein
MNADEVCEKYAESHVGLSIKLLADPEGGSSTVWVQGSANALRMLAELLEAVASESANDGFSISPDGAGRDHFSKESELGIYIHRLVD